MSDQIKVTAKREEDAEAARTLEEIANSRAFKMRVYKETLEEYKRQLIYGLPPAEGLPDVRPLRLFYRINR